MNNKIIFELFEKTGALLHGHFRLTSGLHSPQYFQCAQVLQFPQHAEELCRGIANFYRDQKIDCVVSPAIGGIVVGQEVARHLGCRAIFAEREEQQMTFRRGFSIQPGEHILAVEDVVTTGGSIKEVIELCKNLGAVPMGVGCIVDRSNGKVTFDPSFYSLLQMQVVTYSPETCPLCEQKVPIIKPGSRKVL
jgi:orotate phosphoribosyltransferase